MDIITHQGQPVLCIQRDQADRWAVLSCAILTVKSITVSMCWVVEALRFLHRNTLALCKCVPFFRLPRIDPTHRPSFPWTVGGKDRCVEPSGLRINRRLGLRCRLLLLLALVLGQWLLKNLQDLLVGDLLVRLELGQVPGRGATELGDTVLGDCYKRVSDCVSS